MDDMTETILAKSDQINASDLVTGPLIVTITHVTIGTVEQPRNFHLAEFPDRVYRPSKGMRAVIVKGWGKDSKQYAGRRLKLFRNPKVKWAGKEQGGIEIESMSDIDADFSIPVRTGRNESKMHKVTLLPDAPAPRDWISELHEAAGNLDAIKALGSAARAGGADEAIIGQILAAYHEAVAANE
jgi:hypothetical protein